MKIRCLTNGAIVFGKRLRAGQEIETTVGVDDLAHLAVREAAGDIVILTEPDKLDAIKKSAVVEQRAKPEPKAGA